MQQGPYGGPRGTIRKNSQKKNKSKFGDESSNFNDGDPSY